MRAMSSSRRDVDDGEFDRVEAIIHSMTPEERAIPELINGSRRKRIADGTGTKFRRSTSWSSSSTRCGG